MTLFVFDPLPFLNNGRKQFVCQNLSCINKDKGTNIKIDSNLINLGDNWQKTDWSIELSFESPLIPITSSFLIKYVDSDCLIREKFLGFPHCDLGLSAKASAQIVLVDLINFGLDIGNCCGRGYDRVAVVSGHINELSVELTVKQYIHTLKVIALI